MSRNIHDFKQLLKNVVYKTKHNKNMCRKFWKIPHNFFLQDSKYFLIHTDSIYGDIKLKRKSFYS